MANYNAIFIVRCAQEVRMFWSVQRSLMLSPDAATTPRTTLAFLVHLQARRWLEGLQSDRMSFGRRIRSVEVVLGGSIFLRSISRSSQGEQALSDSRGRLEIICISFRIEYPDQIYLRRYPMAIAHRWPRKLVSETSIETTTHTTSGEVHVGILKLPILRTS